MPIRISRNLPAWNILQSENTFVIDEEHALHQDIRPLEIVILNLMPLKIQTETQLVRLLSNTPLQISLTLLSTDSHISKNTPVSHLEQFYQTWKEVSHRNFDGMIVTGAPIEMLPFSDVDYWRELCDIFAWSQECVTSTLFICWAAQAVLFHRFGIEKVPLATKRFGIFRHRRCDQHSPLLRGFDEEFLVPVSRHTTVPLDVMRHRSEMGVLATSVDPEEVYLAQADHYRQIYCFNHPEYDAGTLQQEYERDVSSGKQIAIPEHYFPHDDPKNAPPNLWRAHANLLYSNWLNYCVYQKTPYDLSAHRQG